MLLGNSEAIPTDPTSVPEVVHEIKLVKFDPKGDKPLALKIPAPVSPARFLDTSGASMWSTCGPTLNTFPCGLKKVARFGNASRVGTTTTKSSAAMRRF
jgi:hypothetical protein